MAGPNDKRLVQLNELLTLIRDSNFHTNDPNSDDKRISFGNMIKFLAALIQSGDYNGSALETLVAGTKNDSTKPVNASSATLGTAGITTANITTCNADDLKIGDGSAPVFKDTRFYEGTISASSNVDISYPSGWTHLNTMPLSFLLAGTATSTEWIMTGQDTTGFTYRQQSTFIRIQNNIASDRYYKLLICRF